MRKFSIPLLLSLLIISLVLLPPVTALKDSEILYCANQNMTLSQCLDFWIQINEIVGNQSCNNTNQTIYINDTQYVDRYINNTTTEEKNCSEELAFIKEKYRHEEELEKLKSNDSCPVCSNDCSDAIQNALTQALSKNNNSSSNNGFFDGIPTSYLIAFLILAGVGFYFYDKKKKEKNLNSSIPQPPQPNQYLPPSILPRYANDLNKQKSNESKDSTNSESFGNKG